MNQEKNKACFFYERNCIGGTKCAVGVLMILEKKNNKWRILKENTIYQT